jgi:putative ABC transport system permease protein
VVARYFKDVDPLGRALRVPMGDFEIVGVVADIRHGGLQSKYESEVFVPYGQISTREMQIVLQTDLDTAAAARLVSNVLADMDPQLAPSEVIALSDLLWESTAQLRFNMALLSTLALCGAVLATLGTYGIVAYSVSRRAREIGVRMALGADAATTVSMIVREALGIVLAGVGLGVMCALAATRLLGQLLFDVQPTDPGTYLAVLAATIAVGVAAAWIPARRATRIHPVVALRE